jgi:hypothetical protein
MTMMMMMLKNLSFAFHEMISVRSNSFVGWGDPFKIKIVPFDNKNMD